MGCLFSRRRWQVPNEANSNEFWLVHRLHGPRDYPHFLATSLTIL